MRQNHDENKRHGKASDLSVHVRQHSVEVTKGRDDDLFEDSLWHYVIKKEGFSTCLVS